MNEQKITRWGALVCLALVLGGLGLRLYQYAGTISNYPFTTYWSESYRIYSASLIYSLKIYGQQLQWPWLDPGRSVLDGLVLLIPGTQIWMFRFWLVFLTIATSTLASVLIIQRASRISGVASKRTGIFMAVLSGWGILFFLQGPIYYHVLLGVLPVLWLFDLRKPTRTLVVILAASVWEGICRVNWFGMPAVCAILLYLLVEPIGEKKIFQYLKWPVVWMLTGLLASGFIYLIFIKLTHYPVIFFNPAMHYPFFTSKLWPNIAFKPGLLQGIAIILLPLVFLIAPVIVKKFLGLHWLRSILTLGILAMFFAGSTYISLRAGGGYDLHNYDTFMLLFFIFAVYVGFGFVTFDRDDNKPAVPSLYPAIALVIMVVFPVYALVRNIHSNPPELSREQTSALLAQLRDVVGNVNPAEGPILFIDQRQLIVYRMIPAVKLYQPFDKIELMEMAMANNTAYRDIFWKAIENKTFPLIISEVHPDSIQDANTPFGYENNVWHDDVSFPILKNYERVYLNIDAGIGVYKPVGK